MDFSWILPRAETDEAGVNFPAKSAVKGEDGNNNSVDDEKDIFEEEESGCNHADRSDLSLRALKSVK